MTEPAPTSPQDLSPTVHRQVIQRHRGLWQLNLGDVWRYRDLLLLLIRREFLAKYKQTILGPTWFVVQPLATTLIFTVIFSRVAQLSTDGLPPTLFYLTGLLVWNYFSSVLSTVSTSLRANAGVFSKVYFPRIIAPLSAAAAGLFTVAIQLVTWGIVLLFVKAQHPDPASFGPTPFSPLFLLIILQTGLLGLGFGLLMAAATAKYRDLGFTLGFILSAWLYLSPVIYPVSQIPEQWQWLASLNPVTALIEGTREILLGQSAIDLPMLLTSVGITIAVLTLGILVFNQVQRSFVDIL